ncbi:M20/M25/M40 family metallo-hydrolase [Oceanispirochaeta sp.]|uniref:M20/M25/M40 family metallo-hydrolase n=1 Tax=Oceanispirochaeta sp. TaxID=2035350 RepID=UPI0026051872|nr:M20/M25/M40 family metallo-hydrolase [Oceanispirochaeta sp.]MDA3958281.1 M20/M25/M40 family metallo-hydrolase [Oceanispirochaeta sp.]
MSEELDEGFTALVSDSIRECGKKVEYYAAPYGCNALISAARRKVPTVILGPGDISPAHKPNENIIIDELLAAACI